MVDATRPQLKVFQFDMRDSESPLIERIWRTASESVQSDMFMSAAAPNWEMVLMKQEGKTFLTIRGPETKAASASIPQDAEFFGIQFKLGAFMPHLHIAQLVNNGINLPDAGSRSFWLHGSAWEFPKFDNADVFIARLVRQGLLEHEPVVQAALQGQTNYLSLRSIQRRFLRATGLTYKTIQQIERARQTAALLEQGVPILDAVFEMGYTDQPHLTRSLKHLLGQTPTQIIREAQEEG